MRNGRASRDRVSYEVRLSSLLFVEQVNPFQSLRG